MPLRQKIKQLIGQDPEKDWMGRPRTGPELPSELRDEFGNIRFEYGDFVEIRGDDIGPSGGHGSYALANVTKTFKLTEKNLLPRDPNDPRSVFFPDGTFAIVKSGGEATLDPRTKEPAWSVEIAMPDGSSGGMWLIAAKDLRTSKPSDFRRRPAMLSEDPYFERIAEFENAFDLTKVQNPIRLKGFDLIASQARIEAIKKKFSKLPPDVVDKLAEVDPSGDAHSNLEWMTKTFYNAYKVQEKGKDRTKPKHGDFVIAPAVEDNRLEVYEVRFDGPVLVGRFDAREDVNVAPPAMGFVAPRDLPGEPSSYPGNTIPALSPESVLPKRKEQMQQGAFEAAKSAAEKFTGAWVWEGEGESAEPVFKNEVDYEDLVNDLSETVYDFEQTKNFTTTSAFKGVEGIKTDLNEFRSLKELQDYIAQAISIHLKDKLIQGAENYELIYEDDDWRVFDVKNKQASCMLALDGFPEKRLRYLDPDKIAKWCISRWEGTYWERYTEDRSDWRMVQLHAKDGTGRKYNVFSANGVRVNEVKNWGNESPPQEVSMIIADILEKVGLEWGGMSSGSGEGEIPTWNRGPGGGQVTLYAISDIYGGDYIAIFRTLREAEETAKRDEYHLVYGYQVTKVTTTQDDIDAHGLDQHRLDLEVVEVVSTYEPDYETRYVITSAEDPTTLLEMTSYTDKDIALNAMKRYTQSVDETISEGYLPSKQAILGFLQGVALYSVSVPEPLTTDMKAWRDSWHSWLHLRDGKEDDEDLIERFEPTLEDIDFDFYYAVSAYGIANYIHVGEQGLVDLKRIVNDSPEVYAHIEHVRLPLSKIYAYIEAFNSGALRGTAQVPSSIVYYNSPFVEAFKVEKWDSTNRRQQSVLFTKDEDELVAHGLTPDSELPESTLAVRVTRVRVPENIVGHNFLYSNQISLVNAISEPIEVLFEKAEEGALVPSAYAKSKPGWYSGVRTPIHEGMGSYYLTHSWITPEQRSYGSEVFPQQMVPGALVAGNEVHYLPVGTKIEGVHSDATSLPLVVGEEDPISSGLVLSHRIYRVLELPPEAQPVEVPVENERSAHLIRWAQKRSAGRRSNFM